MLKLLCVTSHPDDEAGGFGGTLLHYHRSGVETHVLCLTAGTAAKHRGGAGTDAELAELRRREFAASCAILGVTYGKVLEFPDGGLRSVPLLEGVKAIVGHLRRIRPQVVITYGPEGGLTGHYDHGMAGIWTSVAFQSAARADWFPENGSPHQAQKLYYRTGVFHIEGRRPVALAPVTATIDIGDYLDEKFVAFRQHASQAPLFEFFERDVTRHGRKEFFHLAASAQPRQISIEIDLFSEVAE